LCEAGVEPHVGRPAWSPWRAQGIFSHEQFRDDAERDELIGPAGKALRSRPQHPDRRMTEYAARVRDCRDCPLKARCTRAARRVVHRHWDREYLARAEARRHRTGYRRSQRGRKKIEHLFAEAKEQMGLRRARRRGWRPVSEQCLMTALVQNIKRIVAALGRLPEAASAVARPAVALIEALVEIPRLVLRATVSNESTGEVNG